MKRVVAWALMVGVLCQLSGAAEVEWISRPVSGSSFTRGSSRHPSLSYDGRFVVFQSKVRLVSSDKDKNWNIYLFDRAKQTLRRIKHTDSASADGGPVISQTGRMIAYHSYPQRVLRGERPRTSDIVRYDLLTNEFDWVTQSVDSSFHNGEALIPDLSQNGSFCVFSSNATNLLDEFKNGFRSIFLFKADSRSLALVSRHPNGEPANRPSAEPLISARGRFVVFKSAATNLIPPLPLASLQTGLYMWDQRKEQITRVDQVSHRLDPDQIQIGQFDIDDRARRVVFEGFLIDPADPVGMLTRSDLYLYQRRKKRVEPLTRPLFPDQAYDPALSGDGRYLAFLLRGLTPEKPIQLVVMDCKRNQVQKVLEGPIENPTFSGDGRFIAFEAVGPQWAEGASFRQKNVFVVENPFKS